ncbi:MAG: type 4a pilus biogenesis protein PilO [Bacteroidota bacterium]
MNISNLQNKYVLYLLAIAGLSLYLFVTEIAGRYSALFLLLDEYNSVKSQISDIGNFESRRYELLQLKKTYTTEFNKLYKNTTQNDIDLFEYATKLSKRNSVAITSVLPLTNKKNGYFDELSYRLSVRGRFVNIGKLFTDIENGGIPVVLSQIELKKTEHSKSDLMGTIDLKAYIYNDAKQR